MRVGDLVQVKLGALVLFGLFMGFKGSGVNETYAYAEVLWLHDGSIGTCQSSLIEVINDD